MSKRPKHTKLTTAGLLVLAFLLFLYSVVTVNVPVVALFGQDMLASALVGMSATVPANQYNSLDQQLSQKQVQLNEREAALAARERAAPTLSSKDLWGVYSFVMSAFLFVLVGANFYFDTRRGRKNPLSRNLLVDLR